MKKRFETLEAFVQKEIESLGVRLKTEKAERAESDKELAYSIETQRRRSTSGWEAWTTS